MTEEDVMTLARYNAEVDRGLVHTDDWQFRMAALQRAFDREQQQEAVQP